MKKLLFSAYSLDIGGIETALITLLQELKDKYEITLVLEKKQGIFLEELDSKIKVIEYSPSDYSIVPIRKLINVLKRLAFYIKYGNKFDFSASFATYSKSGSFVARTASKNSALWGHADYLTLYNDDKQEMKKFFEELSYDKFKHYIFVSHEGKNTFLEVFPERENQTIYCNNLIGAKRILEMTEEEIAIKKEEVVTFLNVGRQEEKQKKLSRLIEAAKLLKEDGLSFRIIFVGDGPNQKEYTELVEKYNLAKHIIFCGKQKNPYPYFRISDCVVLTSDYEGYPVVFLESFVLNRPIITTKVSDYEQVENGKGMVTSKEVEDIYETMKKFIQEGYQITKPFEAEKYNQEIIENLEAIFWGE